MASCRRLLAVASKETREILRDPITVGVAIFLPLIMMFLFTYAITLDVREIPMAVVDEDRSADSREYVASFIESRYFRLRAAVRSPREAERLLDKGVVRLALVVPAGFSRDLALAIPAQVQTILDGSFANTAIVALNYIAAINESYNGRLQSQYLGRQHGIAEAEPAIRADPRVRYNPDLRSEHYIVPGLFAVILMAFPPLLTALAVVRERERGSILQIYISPIRPWEFLGGKLIPYAAIAFLEMLLLLAVGNLWFQAPVRGSLPLLLALSVLYVLCTVGIGLLISTVTRTQVVAILLSIVLTLMPAFLFSGFIAAIASMPEFFQWYTYLFPARYFMEISRGISLKGVGLERLWPEAVILLIYATALLALASLRFHKKIG